MHEFADRLQFRVAGDLFLEEIFHRLDVVIGGALDVLDALRILLAEILDDGVEHVARHALPSAGTSAICRHAPPGACSQRTSTRTRWRIRPNSLKMGRRLSVLRA